MNETPEKNNIDKLIMIEKKKRKKNEMRIDPFRNFYQWIGCRVDAWKNMRAVKKPESEGKSKRT